MSEGTAVAQQMRPAAESRPLVEHALAQLTLVRFREFWREPGALFWRFAIVDARRKKLLKRLIASPMPRSQYLLSFLLSRLTFLYVEVAALVLFGAFVFGVPVRGSIWELALLCLISSLSFSALGLLVASRVRTIEGASGLMNLVMLAMWIFSGGFFSADRFPAMFQPVLSAF